MAVATATRRALVLGAASAALAGCSSQRLTPSSMARMLSDLTVGDYSARPNERFPVAALDLSEIDRRWLRQVVPYRGHRPGTVVVSPTERHLYLVLADARAMRYGIGVGREGFGWSGEARIGRKAAWPVWTPPSEMIARQPELAAYAGGMPPGLDNPLGARALYLYQGSRDTLYRLHGTNVPRSIGRAVSSGCIRMFNHDVIDLYERVPVGTTVVVLPHSEPSVS
jgi:lipoprotein-anchoring transpeptidase ErfK/SrfK